MMEYLARIWVILVGANNFSDLIIIELQELRLLLLLNSTFVLLAMWISTLNR